jgi:hypothetical protein
MHNAATAKALFYTQVRRKRNLPQAELTDPLQNNPYPIGCATPLN